MIQVAINTHAVILSAFFCWIFYYWISWDKCFYDKSKYDDEEFLHRKWAANIQFSFPSNALRIFQTFTPSHSSTYSFLNIVISFIVIVMRGTMHSFMFLLNIENLLMRKVLTNQLFAFFHVDKRYKVLF